MNRNRIYVFALVLALLVSLAGCGGTAGKDEPAAAPAQPSAAPAPASEAVPSSAAQPEPEDDAIRVGTVGEFLEAIAPGTVIELAPGTYNLSAYLNGTSGGDVSAYVTCGFCADGWQAEVNRVDGLTIRGAADGEVEIVAEPRHADVLSFNGCSDLTIENITLGHTVEQGSCDGAVLGFDGCWNVALSRLDLYGCGTYGVGTSECGRLSCYDSTIRDCRYGALELYGARERQMFLNCVMTGSGGGGSFYADDGSDGVCYFFRCTFGEEESNRFAFDDAVTTEDCIWTEITEYPDGSEWEYSEEEPTALDGSRLKTVSFDTRTLTDEHYYLCYETVDRQSGGVTFESAYAMRQLVFEEGGRGYLLDSDGAQSSFRYAMDSSYSCVLSFDDGSEAGVGLCADQGGALPGSEAGRLWLRLSLGDETLWFY